MIPLMTKQQHARFTALKAEMDKKYQKNAQVFIPVGPSKISDIPARILFIGQATGGEWSSESLSDYDKAWDKATNEVAECAPSRTGGFWQVVDDITKNTFREIGVQLPAERYCDVIGWSNLAKISKYSGNPNGGALNMQADLCVEQLQFEIQTMDPTAIVLLSGEFARKQILYPVFGEDDWSHDNEERDRVAFKVVHGRPVLFLNHPRRMGGPGYRKASVDFAVSMIAHHVRSGY